MLWISLLLLRSGDHARRLRAIAGLEKSGRPGAIAALVAIAVGTSRRAGPGRAQGAETATREQQGARAALVQLGARALPRLMAVYDESAAPARALILEILAAIGGAPALGVVNRGLAEPEPDVRRSAARALSGFPVSAAAVTALDGLLADQDAGVKAAAAMSLGRLGVTTATRALIDKLGDADAEVRAAAATALGELKATAAVEPLLLLLVREGRALASVPVYRALFRIGSPRAINATTNALLELVRSLDPVMGPSAVQLLEEQGWKPTRGDIVAAGVLSGNVRDLAYPIFRAKEALEIMRDKLADRAWAHRRDWLHESIAALELTVSRNDCPHDGPFDSSAPDADGMYVRRCRRCGKESWTDSVGR